MRQPWPQSLIDAAEFERDRRAESYPPLVADKPSEGERLNADYQAWCAIAEWLDTGRSDIIGNWGGIADPPVTVIDWPFIQARTEAAVASLNAMLTNEIAFAERGKGPDDGDREPLDANGLDALRARRDRVFCIHEIARRRRESLDRLNQLAREGLAA